MLYPAELRGLTKIFQRVGALLHVLVGLARHSLGTDAVLARVSRVERQLSKPRSNFQSAPERYRQARKV